MNETESYALNYKNLAFEKQISDLRRRVVLSRIDLHGSKRCLEVGCGLDPLFQYLNPNMCTLTLEPNAEFFENALKKASKFKKAKVINARLEELNDFDKFDFISITSLLHEVPDENVFLSAISSFVDENTIIHFNVPNAKSFHRRLATHMGLIEKVYEISQTQKLMQQEKRPFDMESLTKLVTDYGFKVLESGGHFIKPFTHAQMSDMIKHNLIDEAIINGLYSMGAEYPDFASEIWIDCVREV